ncbi:MAG: transposase, partial [Planctomycetales bacterium]|nr:transposase [Planctomycetales bacterium]
MTPSRAAQPIVQRGGPYERFRNRDQARWTAKRKTQVVLDILKGKTTVAEVSRQHDLTPGEVERWVDEGVSGMENNFR